MVQPWVGYHPLLIGGWAVFYFNPTGLGSRDVDLLFPDRENKDRLVNRYLFTSGYERVPLSEFEERYARVVTTPKGKEHIYLDVATVQDSNRVHGRDIELPWRLAFEHQIPAKIGRADFYVPKPEVLLLFKVKAALDREYDAKRSYDPFFLQQKSWKDYYDVASLLMACELDTDLLARILEKHRFRPLFLRAMHALARKRTVLERRGVRWTDLKGGLGDIL